MIAVVIALISGYVSGRVLALFGRRVTAYEDAEEFLDA